MCIHGYKVKVKKRTLKRRGSLLKHARFLQNLEAFPEYPKEPEPIVEAEGEGEEDEDWKKYILNLFTKNLECLNIIIKIIIIIKI